MPRPHPVPAVPIPALATLSLRMDHVEELEREFAELKQQATAIRRYL